jgi:hypothetical protein
MAIKIPEDAKPARVPDLDLLVGLDAFYKRIVEGEKGIKEKIKTTMGKARAKYGQSDRGVAELRGGGPGKGSISAEKLYDLVDAKKGKKITLEQFLSAIKVESSKLTSFLSGDDIDALRGPAAGTIAPSLYPELRPDFTVDVDGATAALLKLIENNIKAA